MTHKLKGKKQMYGQWKLVRVTWKEYRDEVWLCRVGVRKAKVKLVLNLASDAKNNGKGFYRYVKFKKGRSKKVTRLIINAGKLETTDEEKAEVLNKIFALVSSDKLSFHTSQV